MTCDVISTGSKGNAVVLGGTILVDAGVPFKRLEPYWRGLCLVLLTHTHGDHFNPATICRLHDFRPTLRFGCCEWMVGLLLAAGIPAKQIDAYIPGLTYNYGLATVEAFPLYHDVENCGYKITQGGNRVIYATDTGTMDHVEAKAFDLYMIEANHTEAEIADRIQRKTEAGEFVYEYRVQGTHLSREAADMWLAMNAGPNSKVIYLHGHEE